MFYPYFGFLEVFGFLEGFSSGFSGVFSRVFLGFLGVLGGFMQP